MLLFKLPVKRLLPALAAIAAGLPWQHGQLTVLALLEGVFKSRRTQLLRLAP